MSDRPILIAYDGSEDAKAAIATVGELLTPGAALVVTVWHPGELSVSASAGAATYAPIFGEIDEFERTNARASAEEGAARARAVGFDASPLVVRSDRNVWRAIVDLGAEHDARAIVVGAHGQGRLTVLLLGSVPGRVIHHADRPSWWSARSARAERPRSLRWCRRRVKTDPAAPTGGASSVA